MPAVSRWMVILTVSWLTLSGLSRPVRGEDEPSKEDVEFFETKIRPILSDNCFECHGKDKQKANLRLDSRDAVLKGGDSGAAVDPGHPEDSLLMEAVNYGGDTQMPPKGKLPDEKIADLKEWIKRGAPWPKEKEKPKATATNPKEEFDLQARRARQWAFQPLRPLTNASIDDLLLVKLHEQGLNPSERADKRTLLRRVTFDLIGLPPTPAETAAFLADDSPQAFEKVVDRLLASPHYGERWARHWLDLVRYAETRGHEFDFEIPYAFEYRDYVIRALNNDLPYNQFVVEHLAGDLLPQPRRDPQTGINESIIGTGFFFLGEAKHSPVDLLGDEADRIDNQLDVFGKTFLACTLGCARCHDHKFDAISQADYYAMAGYLQSSRYSVVSIDLPEPRQAIAAGLQKLLGEKQTAREQAIQKEAAEGNVGAYLHAALYGLGPNPTDIATIGTQRKLDVKRLEAWVQRLKSAQEDLSDPLHAWTELRGLAADPDALTADQLKQWRERTAGSADPVKSKFVFADFEQSTWGTWFTSGEAFGTGPVPAPWDGLAAEIRGIPLRGVAHSGALSVRLQGTLRSPTFTITHPQIAYRMAGSNVRVRLVVENLQLIQNPIYGGLEMRLGDPAPLRWYGQAVDKWIGNRAYIEVLDEGDGYAVLDQVLFTDGTSPATPVNVATLLAGTELTSVADAADHLAEYCRKATSTEKPELPIPVAAILPRSLTVIDTARFDTTAAELSTKIAYGRKAVAMVDGDGRDEQIFLRGNPRKRGDDAPRRLLEAVAGAQPPAPMTGSGRLALAQRMVDPANPLTARVIVNRIWKHHFGEGIVRTPDDFGNMGQPPSHPELLDHLAAEFMKDGWSIKRLHRRLVLTAAYQQSSLIEGGRGEARDPQNRLWHRMPIRRLEAEAIRDSILAVSGRLNPTVSGPSVLPHLTAFMIGRGRPGSTGPLDGDGRRSIYISVRRNFLTPFFMAFDTPVPFSTVGRRSVSNVPAQALALMNNPFVIQQADVWARRATAENPDPTSRIRAMYESAFTRLPTEEELSAAQAFVAEQSTAYGQPDHPKAWTDFAHVLMNVKEFIFVN